MCSNDDTILSQTVDWLRFPLVIGVVFIHCYSHDFDMEAMHNAPFAADNIFLWLQMIIKRCLAGLAVPCFFLFSGYYFFYKMRRFGWQEYKTKVRKRFHTLLVPFLLWNMLFVADILLKKNAAFFVKGKPLSNIIVWLQENSYHLFWDYTRLGVETNILGGSIDRFGPIDAPLWFLRDLIVLMLLSPCVYFLIKRLKIYIIILVGGGTSPILEYR